MDTKEYVDVGFQKRIKQVIQLLGGPGKACQKIGVTYTSLQRWRKGESDPSRQNLINIAQAGNIDLLWLATGQGTITAQVKDSDGAFLQEPPGNYNVTTDTASRGHRDPSSVYNVDSNDRDSGAEYVLIPTYDIEVSAGPGLFTQGVTGSSRYLAFRKRWMRMRGLHIENLAVLLTKGDSMVPTIPESAAVVIDRARNTALDGKVYVIRIDDRLFVKRTQWLPSGGLRLISDNKEVYQPTDISPEDFAASNIEVCGQVIHASYDLPD